MRKRGTMEMIALLLVIIGGLNWGLIGAFEFNIVDELFGAGSMLSRIVYIVVGLATLYVIATLFSRDRD